MPTPFENYRTNCAAPIVLSKAKKRDLQGQRFGMLKVLSEAAPYRGKDTAWVCHCDCGKTKVVVGYSLTGGRTKSCGSHPKGKTVNDLTGQRFGKLLVISRAGRDKRNRILWSCSCDCDPKKTPIVVQGSHLTRGHTLSCGCFRSEKLSQMVTRHGQARRSGYSGAYASWSNMMKRCTNSNFRFWKNYGGRGIKVCKRWLKFENFYADMKDRPTGLTLDRNDSNGNYEPENCSWASRIRQAQNQRVRVDSKTKIRGVTVASKNRYKAGITVNGVRRHLGYFPLTPTGLKAAKAARRLAEDLYWGERLNVL